MWVIGWWYQTAMCGGDFANRLHTWVVIEHDTAAAVDLSIDTAGQQQAAIQVATLRRCAARIGGQYGIADAIGLNQDNAVGDSARVAQCATVEKCLHKCPPF